MGAHGILVDDEDIEIMALNAASISHCPAGNSKSGRAIAPVRDYVRAGVNVSLATDGPMSGNHMDMMSVMNMTPKMQKVRYKRPLPLSGEGHSKDGHYGRGEGPEHRPSGGQR